MVDRLDLPIIFGGGLTVLTQPTALSKSSGRGLSD